MLNQELKRTSQAKTGLTGWAGLVRARLKDVRTRPSKALSAHLFFVAFCRQLQCTHFGAFPVDTRDLLSYAWVRTP